MPWCTRSVGRAVRLPASDALPHRCSPAQVQTPIGPRGQQVRGSERSQLVFMRGTSSTPNGSFSTHPYWPLLSPAHSPLLVSSPSHTSKAQVSPSTERRHDHLYTSRFPVTRQELLTPTEQSAGHRHLGTAHLRESHDTYGPSRCRVLRTLGRLRRPDASSPSVTMPGLRPVGPASGLTLAAASKRAAGTSVCAGQMMFLGMLSVVLVLVASPAPLTSRALLLHYALRIDDLSASLTRGHSPTLEVP